MAQLRAHPAAYEPYVGEPYGDYVSRMRCAIAGLQFPSPPPSDFWMLLLSQSGTWGDHLTLQAAADAFRVRLCLLTSYKDQFVIELEPRDGGARQVLWLSFFAEVHYQSLYKA